MEDKISLGQLQHIFAHSVLYKNEGVFSLVHGQSTQEIVARLQVYHNNIYSSLREALAEVYAPIAYALKEKDFKKLAQDFIEESPPISGCLYQYGEGFDAFLASHPLNERFPWMGEAARLCWCTSQALSVENTKPISPNKLSQIPPHQWGELCFQFPKAFFLETVSWDLEPLWAAVDSKKTVNFAKFKALNGFVLIARPKLKTRIYWLDEGLYTFLHILHQGEALSNALESAQKLKIDFDLSTAIQFLLLQELVVDFSQQKT